MSGDADLLQLLSYMQFGVAFNNLPSDNPDGFGFQTPPGTLGPAGSFTDITPFVYGYSISGRGKQHDLDEAEAGQLTITVDNTSGRFSPWNTSGPYYGLLIPHLWVQIVVTIPGAPLAYRRFTGMVSAWDPMWDDPFTVQCQIACYDQIRLWNATNLTVSLYQATVLADGAKSLWRLGDPPGSSTVADSGPNNAVGDPIGSVTFAGPQPLVGDSDLSATIGATGLGYINLPTASVPTDLSNFSVEAWIFIDPNNVPADVQSTLTPMNAWLAGSNSSAELQVVVSSWNATDPTLSTWTARLSVFADTGSPGSYIALSGLWTLSDGNWHHIVGTADSTGAIATIYVDGNASGTAAIPAATWSPITWQEASISTSAVATWVGSLANVAVYDAGLTANQVFVHHELGIAGMVQQRTDQRIAAALQAINIPAGMVDVSEGYATVQANTQSLSQTSALAMCQQAEQTEGGKFFCDVNAFAIFLNRRDLWQTSPYNTVQCTFGDDLALGEIGFLASPTLPLDDVDIYNQAFVQPQGGLPFQYTDPALAGGTGHYGVTQWQPPSTTLFLPGDPTPLYLAQWVVNTHSTPVSRIDSITVDMLSALALDGGSAGTNVETLLGLDVLSRVMVNRHFLPGGTSFSQESIIEQIGETVSLGSDGGTPGWTLTFTLSAIEAIIPWIAASATLGVAGTAIAGY